MTLFSRLDERGYASDVYTYGYTNNLAAGATVPLPNTLLAPPLNELRHNNQFLTQFLPIYWIPLLARALVRLLLRYN